MSKDLVSRKKICGRCGKEIKEGESYFAFAEDFEVGKEDAYDLLTKSYKWSTYHNTNAPSRNKTVCEPNPPSKQKKGK